MSIESNVPVRPNPRSSLLLFLSSINVAYQLGRSEVGNGGNESPYRLNRILSRFVSMPKVPIDLLFERSESTSGFADSLQFIPFRGLLVGLAIGVASFVRGNKEVARREVFQRLLYFGILGVATDVITRLRGCGTGNQQLTTPQSQVPTIAVEPTPDITNSLAYLSLFGAIPPEFADVSVNPIQNYDRLVEGTNTTSVWENENGPFPPIEVVFVSYPGANQRESVTIRRNQNGQIQQQQVYMIVPGDSGEVAFNSQVFASLELAIPTLLADFNRNNLDLAGIINNNREKIMIAICGAQGRCIFPINESPALIAQDPRGELLLIQTNYGQTTLAEVTNAGEDVSDIVSISQVPITPQELLVDENADRDLLMIFFIQFYVEFMQALTIPNVEQRDMTEIMYTSTEIRNNIIGITLAALALEMNYEQFKDYIDSYVKDFETKMQTLLNNPSFTISIVSEDFYSELLEGGVEKYLEYR